MNRTLRVLNVEDSERDVELLRRHLSRAGYDPISERVETAAAMKAALEAQDWDVILCDYSMPHFDALQALAVLKEMKLDIPFIIISGTVGEAAAVEAMRAGAHDYLMKDNLVRLSPTIERETHEVENRRARRRAEAALRESEDRYRDLVEHSHDLICTHDLKGRILSVNQTAARILGYDKDTLLGRHISEALLPDFRHEFDDYIARIQKEGIASGVMTVETRTGEKRIWEYTNTLRTEGVAVPIVRGRALDVTEQRRAEVALKASEAELRAVFEAMTDVILVLDAEGRHLKIAPSKPGHLYSPAAERIGKTLHEVFPTEIADFFLQHVHRALDEGQMHRLEYNLPTSGNEQWFEGSVSPMTRDSVIWIARDITERKRAEEEKAQLVARIESQRQRLNNIVATVPGMVWEAWGEPDSARQRTDFVSDYVETMLGYSVEEWLSTPHFWLSIVHPEDKDVVAREAAETFASGKSNTQEFRWIAKDGRAVWIESNYAVVLDDDGRPAGLRGVTTDISKRKTLEEQLLQAQKMEAIGQLAGAVAHDFNNLLTVISGYSELGARLLREEDPLCQNFNEIKKAADTAAILTRQLLAFSRKQVLEPRVLVLNDVVSELEKLLRRLIGEDIELRIVLGADLERVRADPGQIEQVLMNLAVNARDAMPAGGKLTIETENVYLDTEYTRRHLSVSPGAYVLLAVSDTGTGMDEATRARIFEPFFTTKGIGKGTGLGLSTVYGIVRQSDGNILVYSEVGRGTTFKIYLPRVKEGAQEYKRSPEGGEIPTGTGTILVAEDEGMVRRLAREVLVTCGYQVLEAANGGAALLISERHRERIDLLITDVIMPEMSGRELADRLARLRPEMKVLYMSGYADSAIVHQGVLDEGTNFIQKPFSPNVLARKVRKVLSEE